MRAWKLALVLLATGCSSTGTQASPLEAGLDATNPGDDASADGGLDGGEASLPPCSPLVASQLAPSEDCVFAGPCPESCTLGAASAYACAVGPAAADASASPLYPSAFAAPIGIVSVIASENAAYPWDAGAFVSCAPLACVRWSTGDHTGGGSAWPGDPCADGGDAVQAWACPAFAGVTPPAAGCFATGALGAIGGPGTGVPSQNVWCCTGPADAGAAASDGSVTEAGNLDGGPEGATADAAPDAPPDAAGE
jgi:hypothetical protein